MGYNVGMAPRRFVIPDIHGCARTLQHLVEEVLRPGPDDTLFLLGDYIDRGPASRQVLDLIMGWRAAGYRIEALRGNHEEMFLDACRDRSAFRLWMLNGGTATLESFGVEDACEIPLPYRSFCEDLPPHLLLDDFVLVHAGLNFDEADPFADREAMLWTRSTRVERARIGGRRVVCGHTPVSRQSVWDSLTGDLITLDNGCVYDWPGLGSLTALELTGMTLSFQENIDRQRYPLPQRDR